MHYVAWLIDQGAVPYRDVFDMNLPGAYAIHVAVLRTLGAGDLAWRIFDLGWLAVTAVLLWAYCRPLGGAAAGAGAAMLFTLYHLAGGAWRAGQRDFLLCAPVLVGTWGLARSWEANGSLGPLVWGGVALGAATTVKPSAGVLLLGGIAVGVAARRREPAAALAGAGALLAGGIVAPALAIAWLAWRGGLTAFGSVFGDYVLPLYSSAGRVPVWNMFDAHPFGGVLVALLGALALLGVITAWGTRGAPRMWLALAGAAYGVLHYFAQGKGWEYHLYPLALFLCALAGAALTAVPARPPAPSPPRPALRAALRQGFPLGLLVVLVLSLGARALDALDVPWIARKERRVSALTRDLAMLVPPGERVQVMDTTGGGIHALFRMRVHQPTRFIYDFHFFHHVSDPRIVALRREYTARIEAAPPAAIVVFRDAWLGGGYDRLAELPDLTAFLERHYTVVVDGGGYRIYAKRSHP